MKKVLHILWSGEVGGIERVTYDLSLIQQKAGAFQPHWLLGDDSGYFVTQARATNIPVTALNLHSGFDWRLSIRQQAVRLMRTADILHFHSFIPVFAYAAWRSKRPIIYTEHGNFGFGRQRHWHEWLKEWLKARFLHIVPSMTANSQFTADYAYNRYQFQRNKMQVVYNGINLERFTVEDGTAVRAELGLSEKTFCVGTVCRLAGFKRVDRLIATFAHLHTMCPNSVLVIVGDGPERPLLQQQINQLGLDTAVHLLGYRQDVANVLATMQAFVIPSQQEPFGISAVEAMAQGLPTFAFADGGGVLEIIQQIDEKLVAPDEKILADHLFQLAEDPLYRQKLQERSREVAQHFHIQIMAQQLDSVYRQVVKA